MAPTSKRAVVSELVLLSVVKTKRRFGGTSPRLRRRSKAVHFLASFAIFRKLAMHHIPESGGISVTDFLLRVKVVCELRALFYAHVTKFYQNISSPSPFSAV
jgi:hypothetical protein